MWRDEYGMMEMLLSYISEFNDFKCWSNWRPILVDILSCHENERRQRESLANAIINERRVEPITQYSEMPEVKEEAVEISWSVDSFRPPALHANTLEKEIDSVAQSECDKEKPFLPTTKGNNSDKELSEAPTSAWDITDRPIVHQPFSAYGGSFHQGINQPFNDEKESDAVFDTEDSSQHVEETLRETHVLKRQIISCSDRRFTCEYCAKSFTRNAHLRIHERIHTGERPHECNICGKKFAQKNNLLKHRRIHHNLHPYSCNVCGQGFDNRSELHTHQRSHFHGSDNF